MCVKLRDETGVKLNQLLYAEDKVLMVESVEDFQHIVSELERARDRREQYQWLKRIRERAQVKETKWKR